MSSEFSSISAIFSFIVRSSIFTIGVFLTSIEVFGASSSVSSLASTLEISKYSFDISTISEVLSLLLKSVSKISDFWNEVLLSTFSTLVCTIPELGVPRPITYYK